jgi:nitroreductase
VKQTAGFKEGEDADMTEHPLYEAIFKRKSIRKYDMNGMEEATLTEIRNAIQGLVPLDPTIRTSFVILNEKETRGGLFAITAPYYIAVYAEPKDGHLMNAGFMLQQMELLLSAKEIGCCWLGMAKPNKTVAAVQDMEFIVVLAIGYPLEPIHRSDILEFKRKTLEEITNIQNIKEDPALFDMLEAARLAPSATNSQPWYFTGGRESIRVFRRSLNPVTALIYDRMNQIDIGIVLCHIWAAGIRQGKKVDMVRERGVGNVVKGYGYCITVLLN